VGPIIFDHPESLPTVKSILDRIVTMPNYDPNIGVGRSLINLPSFCCFVRRVAQTIRFELSEWLRHKRQRAQAFVILKTVPLVLTRSDNRSGLSGPPCGQQQ
jgi:hypothetical protein